jgi:hypothetical protein
VRIKRSYFGFTLIAVTLALSIALIGRSSADGGPGAEKIVTFNKDVAPILFKSCADCHRPGEAAPMSLLSYKDARPWAKSIREKVITKQMPPWHADPHYGDFSNDRRLSSAEIETITAWVDSGAREGDPKDLPATPPMAEGWRLGKPDMILQMPEEFTLDATGPDEYRYFEVPTNFTEDRYVQAAEARPGNRKIVHHIIAAVVPPPPAGKEPPKLSQEEIQKQQAQADKDGIFRREGFLSRLKPDAPVHDDGCAMASGGSDLNPGGDNDDEAMGWLCEFAPGHDPDIWKPGVARKIPAGSKILLQIHYSKNQGTAQKDRSVIGLVFAKEPPDKLLMMGQVQNILFKIPPGAERHKVTACWTAKNDIHVISLMPHMHLRGVAMKYEAFYPDGRSEILLDVPNYSFAWQTTYYPRNPLAAPKGTRFVATSYFDNSTKNKYNPDPKQAVRFGEPTYDEMMIGFMEYTVDSQHLRSETAAKTGSSASK